MKQSNQIASPLSCGEKQLGVGELGVFLGKSLEEPADNGMGAVWGSDSPVRQVPGTICV